MGQRSKQEFKFKSKQRRDFGVLQVASACVRRPICHSVDSALKCTSIGLIWRALIKSGHVLTLSNERAGHQHTHTLTPKQHLFRMCVNTRRQPHKSTASRWTASRNARENFNDASRRPSLFLPPLCLRRACQGVLLTGPVVCVQQMWDETHPGKDPLILCALVKASSPSSSLPRSAAAAGRRCVSQGHDAGSVLLIGPASGRWTHTHTHVRTQLYFSQACTLTVMQNPEWCYVRRTGLAGLSDVSFFLHTTTDVSRLLWLH